MDAPCKIQGSIHVFRLVNNMCPGKWVHIRVGSFFIRHMIRILCFMIIVFYEYYIYSTCGVEVYVEYDI